MAAVAAFEFLTTSNAAAWTQRMLISLQYGVVLVIAGLSCGLVVWTGLRIFQGVGSAPEAKESVLWFAAVLVVLVTAVRMIR